ncbi:MAG: hypothetical protein QM796_18705 [Chthoniobacteraceae bacterium]
MKKPTLKIKRLLQRHLSDAEKAKTKFQRSGLALDEALALGVPLNEMIELRDGRQVVITDQFAQRNIAFSAKLFQRYKVDDYK